MFIQSDDCLTNVAVATQWIILSNNEWIELGVTQGGLQDLDGDGTGDICIPSERVYYAYNLYDEVTRTTQYSEFTILHDFDTADILNFEIKRGTGGTNWLLYLKEYSAFPIANFNLRNIIGHTIQLGLESTLRADQYSSIGVAKFVDSEKLQNGVWSDNRLYNTNVATSQGYKLTKCDSTNTFVAGIVTELDCNDLPMNNVSLIAVDKTIQIGSDSITIPLEVMQPNNQYVEFNLVDLPTQGTLDYNNKAQEIPNQTPETAHLVYTPISLTNSDTITYSVSDGEFSDNGIITLEYSTTPDCQPNEICNIGTQPPSNNHTPTISVSPRNSNVNSGDVVTLTATVSDSDDVTLSWNVQREDIDITLALSNNDKTAAFTVPYDDTVTSATYIIRVTATDEHQASTSPFTTVVLATISPTSTVTSDPVSTVNPIGDVVFLDDFESGNLNNWVESGESKLYSTPSIGINRFD